MSKGPYYTERMSRNKVGLLKDGWAYVPPNVWAWFWWKRPRPTFVGNHCGIVSVTRDRGRYSEMSRDQFTSYFNDPRCPYACAIKNAPYKPEPSEFAIVLKPLELVLFAETQLLVDMDATDERAAANAASEKQLTIAKAEALARVTTPTIEKIKTGLQAEDRVMYAQVKSELMQLIADGKISPMSNLEMERITLMRMVEIKGLMDTLRADPHATTEGQEGERVSLLTREAIAFLNLARQIGNEAQRVTESGSTTKKNGKSAFQALEELVKSGGVKIEITKADEKPQPIDADYKVLLEDSDKKVE